MHLGGLTGKSLLKSIDKLYWPPYHGESFGPGMIQFHLRRLTVLSGLSLGLATKPKGWSERQSFLSFLSRLMTSSLTYFFMRNLYKKD
jgi:hypothetical protein